MSKTLEKHTLNLFYSSIDEAFDPVKVDGYQLILQLGVDGVSICVKEKLKNKYIALETFAFSNLNSLDQLVDNWDALVKKSKLMFNKYKSVVCIVVNNSSTIIPEPLYEEGSEKMYLKFNVPVEWNEFVLVNNLKSIDAKNVFVFPFELKAKLEGMFSAVSYHHYSTVLIENIIAQNKNKTTKKLYLHVQQTHFEIVLIEGKKLLFYNTFNYYSAEDFIYYTLFVCEQLQLNPENIETVVLGEINKNSSVHTIVQKYIRNIKFGERSDEAEFAYQLQTLPKHTYFTVFINLII